MVMKFSNRLHSGLKIENKAELLRAFEQTKKSANRAW